MHISFALHPPSAGMKGECLIDLQSRIRISFQGSPVSAENHRCLRSGYHIHPNTVGQHLFFHGFYNHSLEFRRISFVWYSFWHSKTPHLLDSISYCLTNGVQFISAICRESLYYTLNAAMYFTEAACSIWAKIATLRREKTNVAGNKSHYRSSTGDIFKLFTVSRKRGSHAPL